MKISLAFLVVGLLFFAACEKLPDKDEVKEEPEETKVEKVDKSTIQGTIAELKQMHGGGHNFRIERGVSQVAALWREEDGGAGEFKDLCMKWFIADADTLEILFQRLSDNFETLYGHYHAIDLKLREPVDLTTHKKIPVDEIFAAFNPYAHMADDFFKNKIAFVVNLNFPFYSLAEKEEMGKNWNRRQWAYARIGDMFASRVPADRYQKLSKATSAADNYISNYNIHAAYLKDNEGNTYFDTTKVLITHWNLRDEIKSLYADSQGLPGQKIIYEVMKRIINQDIPQKFIDNNEYYWNPYKNELYVDSEKIEFIPEPDVRYSHILNIFHAMQEIDKYEPHYPTWIKRKFEGEFEIPQEQVEKLFVELVSSPVIAEVGELIKKRLGRDLQPFDIWYDGFKTRSKISADVLNAKTREKYPNPEALKKDLPNILLKIGFTPGRAEYIASKIAVDPSRGAGHASGAEMRDQKSHLRTRIGEKGMDYKGYNIAIHEFGHNVEQTITMQDVDYYALHGVPNTAFTEAWAFIFQKKDLELLGMSEENPDKEHLRALDHIWSAYEIMGVSIVDMHVWKWLYDNPEATPAELKESVIGIAKEVWNKYYAPVFGMKDEPILAIYSHMIDVPLYLPAYPIGELIEFQIGAYVKDKNLADEMERMLVQGRLLPQIWMKGAVGNEISAEPLLKAAMDALASLKGSAPGGS